jgi:hypothetical protein
LKGVRGDEHPSLSWRKVAMKASEDEGAQTERSDGGACFDPSYTLRGRDKSKAKVYRVACAA